MKMKESIGSRISAFSFTTSHVIQDGGAYRLDEEYGLIITEHSTPEKVQRVERAFQEPEDLELLVEGKPFGIQRAAATDETVLDTDEVLQKLRDEGLVMRPESVASGGVKFELVASDSLGNQMSNPKVRRLPPICLQRREKQRKRNEI
ncbi:uncharacterized protein LOC143235449 isoform X2 [Tachypleus tridentatus]|uniref:uncharacterized protein LOC143235449 isoform X2 n=1 Tax=Tachypleus tridentatus TaxID=6853 RepID=UPI003FD5957F